MLKRLAPLGVLLLLGLLITAFVPPPSPCNGRCNVILIMVDTLSAKHIKAYGYDRDTLPRTSAFFEEHGAIFENATANSAWTLPSFVNLYFSDIATNVTYQELTERTRPTLQSELRSHGYRLHAITPPPKVFILDAIVQPFYEDEIVVPPEYQAFATATGELPFLAAEGTPFFLLVHTFEVHDPYQPDGAYAERFDELLGYENVTMVDILKTNETPGGVERHAESYELRYDQGIAAADDRIASFLESIPEEMLRDTAIILSADHGEAFGEHGTLWHGQSLYEEELRIPLMARVPGMRAERVQNVVSTLDIAPTILELAGVPVPEGFTGDSLVPLLRGQSFPERVIPLASGMPYYFTDISSDIATVVKATLEETGAIGADRPIIEKYHLGARMGSHKLIEAFYGPDKGSTLFFDLAKDPRETENLIETDDIPLPLTDMLNKLKS